jgi:hypothetical protein
MKSFIELGKGEQVIEWREHLLSDAMKARGLDGLAIEPELHPKEAFAASMLDYRSDGEGISWAWQRDKGQENKGPEHWDHVYIEASDAKIPNLVRRVGKTPHVTWREVNYCEYLELTPYLKTGVAGVTFRVERPLTVAAEEIVFNKPLQGDPVRIELPNYTSTSDVIVQLFRQNTDHEFIREGRPITFNEDGLAIVPYSHLSDLRVGVIAVIRRGRQRQLLLGYRAYWIYKKGDRRLGNGFDDDEWSRISLAVENREAKKAQADHGGVDAWLEQWPTQSQKYLRELYQHAHQQMPVSAAAQTLRNNPTGLLRSIVLGLYNFSAAGWGDQRIRQLDDGTFEEALARLSPTLPSLLQSSSSPAAKEWVMNYANHPRVSDIVKWAAGGGVAALDMALALIDVREATISLKSQLRPDSAEGQEVAKLLTKIELAPREPGESSPEQLRLRLGEIMRRVQQDEQRPIDAEGEAPATNKRYDDWSKSREKTSRWRRELAQVINYCESGKLELPDKTPTAENLELRLQQIEKPSAPSLQRVEDARSEELKRLVHKLLDRAEDEAREALRHLASTQLQRVVLPYAAVWGPLHLNINKAHALSSAYPWFAAHCGLKKGQGKVAEQAQAAECFLQLVTAAESFAGTWEIKSQDLKRLTPDRSELVRILSTPDHPWVTSAYKRCSEWYNLLLHSSFIQDVHLPASMTPPPQALSPQSLRAWWEWLHNLDNIMSRLEWGKKRFESYVKNLKEDLLPQLKEYIAGWRKYAPDKRPPYFKDLAELYEKCFGQDGAVTPANLSALLNSLNRTPWRKDYETITRRVSK